MKQLIVLIALIILFSCKKNEDLITTDIFTDYRDNQTYKTKQYGNQTWFIENLNYDKEGSRYYNKDSVNKKYGRLYNWEMAQNICPEGWKLPSNEDWKELEKYLNQDSLGICLKSDSLWKESNYKGKNTIEFNALPAGVGTNYGDIQQTESTYFWTSTNQSTYSAYHRALKYDDYKLETRQTDKSYYYSIRCIKD